MFGLFKSKEQKEKELLDKQKGMSIIANNMLELGYTQTEYFKVANILMAEYNWSYKPKKWSCERFANHMINGYTDQEMKDMYNSFLK